ncbi:hypothetical protein VTK26DRAFT_6292 [Humicola hyalothermophila]
MGLLTEDRAGQCHERCAPCRNSYTLYPKLVKRRKEGLSSPSEALHCPRSELLVLGYSLSLSRGATGSRGTANAAGAGAKSSLPHMTQDTAQPPEMPMQHATSHRGIYL